MNEANILWIDDEIDLLKIQILFLKTKGHKVTTANNGYDALDLVKENNYDIIFLDENMPGMNGLEVLQKVKEINPNIPIVMVTKNEEEDIMDEAIGSKISDYLIKPVNPKQLLLVIKKNVENKRLITEKTNLKYQTEFTKLSQQINQVRDYNDWIEVYKKLIYWEIELSNSNDNTMDQVLTMQKDEANDAFTKFIKNNYLSWFDKTEDKRPIFQTDVFKNKVFPLLDAGEKVVLIVVDNLRFDHWKTVEPMIREYLNVEKEEVMVSILPTATQYARNAMFSGLMPLQIEKMFPNLWSYDDEEGGKNEHEEELLKTLFDRYRKKVDFHFEKVFQNRQGEKVVENIKTILKNQLVVIVYNFVDMLSHARTEMQMIKELAQDEAAYRSLVLTWFEHSALFDLIKEISNHNAKLIITTDHGAVRVQNAIKVIGDRNTTTNLRYKQGKNLNYNKKEVFEILKPEKAGLPCSNLSSTYIFTTNKDFFAYPNNYNHYVKYFKDTFQHGGVCLRRNVDSINNFKSKKIMLILEINDIKEIDEIAKIFVKVLKITESKSNCFAFYGTMGAGKTTFIKAICKQLGISDNVSSPTFAIVNQYLTSQNKFVYHFDFYRINKIEEAFDFGYEEYFYSNNLCFIEWPELIESLLPKDFVKINIEIDENNKRIIRVN